MAKERAERKREVPGENASVIHLLKAIGGYDCSPEGGRVGEYEKLGGTERECECPPGRRRASFVALQASCPLAVRTAMEPVGGRHEKGEKTA